MFVVNVNRAKDFAETRKHEQEMERQVMQNVRRMAHDTMTEKQQVCVCDCVLSVVVFTSRHWETAGVCVWLCAVCRGLY